MIYYKKCQNFIADSPAYHKWYARAVPTETVDLDGLAQHMANHNTPYSKGAIKGMLTDMVQCVKELLLEGKNVKLPDLAIFSVGLQTQATETAAEFTAANIKGYKLRARATGDLRPASFKGEIRVTEMAVYDGGESAATGA